MKLLPTGPQSAERPIAEVPASIRAIKISRALLLAGVGSMPMVGVRLYGQITISDICLGLSAVMLLLTNSGIPAPPLPRAFKVASFLTLIGGLLAAGIAQDPFGSLTVTGRLLMVLLMLPWLWGRHLATDSQLVRKSVLYYCLGCAIFGLVSIGQLAGYINYAHDNGRYQGLAEHVTDAGGICALGAVLALSGLASIRHKVLSVLLLALTSGGLILSGSVSGLIALVAGVLALVAAGTLCYRSVLLGSMMTAALVVSTRSLPDMRLILPTERLESTTSGRYNTLVSRWETITFAANDATKDWQSFLLGRGLDAASGQTSVEGGLAVHNMLVLAWWQGGVLLVVALMIVIGWLLRSLPHVGAAGLSTARNLKAATLSMLIFSMTSPLLFARYIWFPAILLVATLGLEESRQAIQQHRGSPREQYHR